MAVARIAGIALAVLLDVSISYAQACGVDSAVASYSATANPNAAWSYREGANALPAVEDWEGVSNSWVSPQAGWARSEESTNRIPFFFKSNGSEQFAHDWQAGDLVVHTTDDANGIGNGAAELVWTSPFTGRITISGAVWMGREIGRANHWTLFRNGDELAGGDIASGDAYSRSSPFDFESGGHGGPSAIDHLYVRTGDEIRLVLTRTSQYGDFVGIEMNVSCSETFRDCGDAALRFSRASVAFPRQPANATDALFVLKTAVQQFTCDLCVCDVNSSGSITASDALLVLKSAVGTATLGCPACS